MIINIFNNNIYYMKPFSKNKNKLQEILTNQQIKDTPTTKMTHSNYKKPTKSNERLSKKKIKYLDGDGVFPDVKLLSKYKSFSLGIYCIKNTNTNNPFLMYLFNIKRDISIFPVYNIEQYDELSSIIENINQFFEISKSTFKKYIEHNNHLYFLFEVFDLNIHNNHKTMKFFPIYDFILEGKCDEIVTNKEIIELFIEHDLLYLRDENNRTYDIPISVISNNREFIISSVGPIKDDKNFNFFSLSLQEPDTTVKVTNKSKDYKKFLIFLKNTKYIFSHSEEIDYNELLKSHDSIFLSKHIFTEKSSEYPSGRFIIKNNTDIIYM